MPLGFKNPKWSNVYEKKECCKRLSRSLLGRFCRGPRGTYTRLLRHLSADKGVALVIVNHLRTLTTLLDEILPSYMEMPVELITKILDIASNHVFIIPEQLDLHVLHGEFRLKTISKPRGRPDVITVFLRSMPQHWDGKLIAVIVSGYDSVGAAALCSIKVSGGRYHRAEALHGRAAGYA